jgi:antitoxin YefM
LGIFTVSFTDPEIVHGRHFVHGFPGPNLVQIMKRVCADHDPLIIARNGEPSVVMLSLEDFKALEETAYLLRSPRNARRLMDAFDGLEAGHGHEHGLGQGSQP